MISVYEGLKVLKNQIKVQYFHKAVLQDYPQCKVSKGELERRNSNQLTAFTQLCVNVRACPQKYCEYQRVSERTDWAGGVCLDHAAEFCDRLLQESALPVQHVPEGRQETDQVSPNRTVTSTIKQ